MGKKKKRGKYRWKTTPYHHQIQAVKKLMSTGWGGALLMEPRTGKTKVAIDYASILHQLGKVNRVLVFSPVGVMSVWEEEIPKHCPVPHRVLIWDKKARKDTPLPNFGKDRLDFVVVNYDAASTPPDWRRDKHGQIGWYIPEKRNGRVYNRPVPKGTPEAIRLRARSKGGRFAFKRKIQDWQPQLIILDESHRVKSPSARKSALVHALGPLADFRVLMTGTVVTKKKRIWDVYSQWKFLNPLRFWSRINARPLDFSEFKDNFSVTTKRNGYPQWLRNKNEDKLHSLIHVDSFSVRRDDVFDMPPLTSQIIPIHLDESGDAYDQMAEDMVARIRTGEITEASIALVQGLRLRQLSNGIARTTPSKAHPKGRLVIIGREKLQTLEDRLEDLMEADEHVIIGAVFRPDLQRIQRLCKKRKWDNWLVMGGVKVPDRKKYRQAFEKHDGGAIFIGNPAAASEGIDLRSSAILIWYSLPTSWVQYRQYMDRNALHSGPRFVEYLLADGADRLAYETLMEDEDMGKKFITSPERLLRDRRH